MLEINNTHSNVHQLSLNGRWQFRQQGGEDWLPATVPGCNFTDLIDNKVINDPFYRDEETRLQWIEQHNWEYRKVFSVNATLLASAQLELVFDGLDTYCEIYLNNHLLKTTANMFVGYRVPCKKLLVEGDNELRLVFRSPINEALPIWKNKGITYPAESDKSEERLSVFTRKAPYHFGWDWGPRFVTSGIWREVFLEATSQSRISDVYVKQLELTENIARLAFEVSLEHHLAFSGKLELGCANHPDLYAVTNIVAKPGEQVVNLELVIHEPQLWWPNGLGDAYLYQFQLDLISTLEDNSAAPQMVSREQLNYGVRTIEVINEPDAQGECFYVKVNGHPVFMKGANYIPSDSFLNRVSDEKYHNIFKDCVAANMNMLRVWGGGIYENDIFYQLADANGILVWQDFMFACTLYPADQNFIENVKAELHYNIKRLRNHACVALWCGNNETEMGIECWNWQQNFGYSASLYDQLKTEYATLFKEVIPSELSQLDPARFYFSSSPIGFWERVEDDNRGDNHYWGVWHGEEPFSEFKKRIPRFMSEFGFQSFPLIESVKTYSIPEDWHLESTTMKVHQKHPRGNKLIASYMAQEYREPKDFEHFLYMSQVQQAQGMKIAFNAHRSAMEFCMGSLYWQLNDCWPVASWSGIDYLGRFKAMHYQVRRSFEPIAVFAEQDVTNPLDPIKVTLVSDLLEAKTLLLDEQVMNFDGSLLWQNQQSVTVQPSRSELVSRHAPSSLGITEENRHKVVYVARLYQAEVGDVLTSDNLISEDLVFFVKTKEQQLQPVNYQLATVFDNNMLKVSLRADTLARQVYVSFLSTSANFSDNFFDLLPGEEKHISLSLSEAEKQAITEQPQSIKVCSIVDSYTDSSIEISVSALGNN